jgi:sulfane dehydrogenase subunit SoxC
VAKLQEPVLSIAHTYFRHLWNWNGDTTEIMSRAVDDTGNIQTTLQQLINAHGTDLGGCHLNPVNSWIVKRSGDVLFKTE